MSESILVAVITAVGAVFGQWIISSSAKRKQTIEEAKREQRLDDRLKDIEDRLKTHNDYASKLGELQLDIAEIRKDIEYISKR